MITVTKRFEISYGHRLPNYPGDCARQHGHNAIIEIELKGATGETHLPIPYDGMIIDFKDIKKYMGPIIGKLDHAYINDILLSPTCENMTDWIVQQIKKTELKKMLVRVKVTETSDSWAEWRKD